MYESCCKTCGKHMVAKYQSSQRSFCSRECRYKWLRKSNEQRKAICEPECTTPFRDMSDDGFVALIAAIVDRASMDVLTYSADSYYRQTAEYFFRSDYFGTLTGLDGKPILQALLAERMERARKKNKGGKSYATY